MAKWKLQKMCLCARFAALRSLGCGGTLLYSPQEAICGVGKRNRATPNSWLREKGIVLAAPSLRSVANCNYILLVVMPSASVARGAPVPMPTFASGISP